MSQIDDIIAQVERGEDIDSEREVSLLALRTVKAGEEFAEEMIGIMKGEVESDG